MRKRRVRVPKPRFQLRMVGAFCGLCSLALLAQAVLLGAELTRLANALPYGGAHVTEAASGIVGRVLLLSCGLLLPAVLLIGIRLTFRIAGPLYRFEQHLSEVARGEDPGPCRIRGTDDGDMHRLCDLVNAALARARADGETASEALRSGEKRAAG